MPKTERKRQDIGVRKTNIEVSEPLS